MTAMKNNGGPAFPMPSVYSQHGDYEQGVSGMSLRDWFAGQALAGMLSGRRDGEPQLYYLQADGKSISKAAHAFVVESKGMWAVNAYALADAMLKARSQEPS